MKKIKYIYSLVVLISSIVLFSCEKVIDIDLKEAEPRLVIEGNITSETEPYKVYINKSGGYFDNTAVQPVENGIVRISDDEGNSEILTETTPGVYQSNDFVGVENRNYSVQVEVNGETFSGSDYLPPKINIDSLYYEKDDFSGPGPGSDPEQQFYSIYCTFTDPADTANYYRFITYINGERVDGHFNPYRVFDDLFFDGNTITLSMRRTEAQPGDTVRIDLQAIGFNTHEYFRTLNDALSGGGMGSTPYNPISNLDNGALGYFGAYSVTSDSLVILE